MCQAASFISLRKATGCCHHRMASFGDAFSLIGWIDPASHQNRRDSVNTRPLRSGRVLWLGSGSRHGSFRAPVLVGSWNRFVHSFLPNVHHITAVTNSLMPVAIITTTRKPKIKRFPLAIASLAPTTPPSTLPIAMISPGIHSTSP